MFQRSAKVLQLPFSKLFETDHSLSDKERARVSFQRAKAIVTAYGLTRRDIEDLSPAYWALHTDPILTDGGATTLLTIQINLVAGTIAAHAQDRPDLSSLLDDLLSYKIGGHFCLTEVEHGLDAMNLETTATALPCDQGFVLNTPHPGAAKCMPPTAPCGVPYIAVVYARLIVGGKFHGVKPFLVPMDDGYKMRPGITVRLLPKRGGSDPVNHSITSFDNVHLLPTSLLRPGDGTMSPEDQRVDFLLSIWRVAVGSISLAAMCIPGISRCAYIAAKYSQRRTVAAGGPIRVPLMHFSTQHTPILTALAQSFVLASFLEVATKHFCDEDVDFRVRHGVAAVFKVTAVQHGGKSSLVLSERCGAQGLFGYNQIYRDFNNLRGMSIAEGDVLALSIRLASEIILDRYALPSSTHPSSPLSQHEQGLIQESRDLLSSMAHHRGEDFNQLILPRSQPIIEAIGMRMAYDAAVDAGLDKTITDLYLVTCMEHDLAWYCESLGVKRLALLEQKRDCVDRALPKLDEWLYLTGHEHYVTAPIISQDKWDSFVGTLEVFSTSRVANDTNVRANL